MDIIATIVIGFIVGLLARMVMPGKDPAGFILTVLLGIGGAFVGTFLGRALNLYAEGDNAGFLMSLVGAMLLVFVAKKFRKVEA